MNVDKAEIGLLTDALIRMNLLAAGEEVELTALSGGVSSQIVRIVKGSETFCLKRALPKLKVSSEWIAPVERNVAEVAWLRLVNQIIPGCAPKILGEDRRTFSFAMEYLEPETNPVWKDQLMTGHIDSSVASALAKRLSSIHAATAGLATLAREFANDRNFYALRLEPYFSRLAFKYPDLADSMRGLIVTTLSEKRALVHGDVSPKNILISHNGPVLLDAECACYGDPAFDLAFCLNHFLLKSSFRPASLGSLLECFEAMTATYLSNVNWESASQLEARAARLLPVLLLARIDGASPVEYIEAPEERNRIRNFAIPMITRPPERLATLCDEWSRSRTGAIAS